MSRGTQWQSFLAEYHAARPGITEDLLAPTRDGSGRNPYAWLAAALPATGPILDLACGSAPLRRAIGGRWIGVDRSGAELRRAADRGPAACVEGDATALAIASGTCAAVVCSMALMLLPTAPTLAEVSRVLRPGGTLHLLLPDRRPLSAQDRLRFAALYATLRMPARLPPTSFRRHPRRSLASNGFIVTDDTRARFAYSIDDTQAARRLVDGLYLPGARAARIEAAYRLTARWIGSEIGLPLRRIVAQR